MFTSTFVLALAFLAGMVWDGIEDQFAAAINTAMQPDGASDIVVLSFATAGLSVAADAASSSPNDNGIPGSRAESCPIENGAALSLLALPIDSSELVPFSIAPRTGHDVLSTMGIVLASANSNGAELVSYARHKMLPKFSAAYRSVLKLVSMMGLPRIQDEAALTHATIMGIVSTYNPYRDGNQEGDGRTASGELYDPAGWTAAIQVDLRNQFGGVRYGKLYQPAYALVESGDKQVIVKINDVGPLKPGRVLDLNERSMRHFDPFLTRGLLDDAKITLLPGEDWTPGPVGGAYVLDFAAAERHDAAALTDPIVSADWDAGSELAQAMQANYPPPISKEDVRAEAKPSEGG